LRRNSESLGDKHAGDEQNGKFAAFEKPYIGPLAGSQDKKLKILAEQNSQLDANAQTPHRGEPDQSYTPPCLAQQLPRNAPLPTSTCPQALQQQWVILQSQFRFHPSPSINRGSDGVKTRSEIAAVQRQLMEAKAAAAARGVDTGDGVYEPSSRRHNGCGSKFTSPGKRSRRPPGRRSIGDGPFAGIAVLAGSYRGSKLRTNRTEGEVPWDCRCSFLCRGSLPAKQCPQACRISLARVKLNKKGVEV
jgi:hypothetical protein